MKAKTTYYNLDQTFIQQVLPHRPPMLLVDDIKAITLCKEVHATYQPTLESPWFDGHFPNNPIFPGVMILEAMAQAGGFLFIPTFDSIVEPVLGFTIGYQNVKFKKFVLPNEVIHLYGKMQVKMTPLARVSFEAKVDDSLVASAEISYIIGEAEAL